jgi:predicted phage terminase large subunit-like protein
MSLIYPHEDRARARSSFIQLNNLAQEAKKAAERGLILPERAEQAILQLTQTSDRSNQVDALSNLAAELQKRHLERLQPLARDDFNAFCEYVNPEEAPTSKWHVWLTNKLQEIEFDPELDRFILNCPPGHAKPLHIDTPVLMGSGAWKRLGDIQVGEKVISDTGAVRLVEAVHDQGVLPLLKITTARGRSILSAGDHSFKVRGAWVQAQDLRPGDPLEIVGRSESRYVQSDTSGQSLDMFALAGYLAALGGVTTDWTTPRYRMWFSNFEHMENASALCARLKIKSKATWDPVRERFLFRLTYKSVAALREVLRLDDVMESRRVPAWVYRGDAEKVRTFLTLLLQLRAKIDWNPRDATVVLPHRSVEFLRDIQRLLTRFGVDAVLKHEFERKPRLVIAGAALAALHAADLSYPGSAERTFLAKLKAEPSKPTDTVRMVETAGEGPCKCLTVKTDHTFLADGVVVHNSTYASRLFVAWRLGRNPNLRIIGGGHSQRFVENEFSAKIRNLVSSPDYKKIFPDLTIDYSTRAKDQWAIAGKTGQYAAKGVGQAVHGFRANFVCVDDPYAKIEEAESAVQREKVNTWFVGDLGSRMLPFGKMFLIMTRFHEEDLTGHLMEMNKRLPSYAQWMQVEAPALCIDPDTDVLGRKLGEVLWDVYDLAYMVTKQREWSFQRFSLVYQQNASATSSDSVSGKFNYYDLPPHLEDAALKKAKIEGHVDEAGRPKPNRRAYFRKVILSVDTASKPTERADYTVIQTWGETHDRRYYLLRQTRVKVAFNEMIEVIEKQARKDDVDVILVEDKGQGTAYIQARGKTNFQKRLAPAPIEPIDPKGQSKEFRFDEITPMINEGSVFLPKRAPYLDAFLKEVAQFPEGAHDDQVDSMSQALRYFKSTRTRFGSKKIGSFG